MRYKVSIYIGQFAAIAILCAGLSAYADSGPYGKLPLSFEPNHGQTASSVQWLARGPGYALYLAGADAVLQLHSVAPPGRASDITASAVRMKLLGAKAHLSSGEELQSGKANYFSGNDPAKWLHDVPLYGKVRQRSVYPGVDLLYYGRQGQLEYDFVIAPDADASAIRLRFDGATPSLEANGDLVLVVEGGEKIRFSKPAVYQTKDGIRQAVAGRFAINARKQVSFHLGAYDHRRELTIDPTLDFLGTLGTGSYGTVPNGMTVDALGEIILTGYTYDPDFPASSAAYQTTCGDVTQSAGGSLVRCGLNRSNGFSSAFVAKISADGGSLLYATYLHGMSGYESGASVAADLAGNAYVLGATGSDDFPITADAYQTLCDPNYPLIVAGTTGSPFDFYPIAPTCYGGGSEGGGPSLFISKLNATGSTLLYSTFFGGTAAASPVAIALDSTNNIYFTSQLSQAPPEAEYYPNGSLIPFPTAPLNSPGPISSPPSAFQPSGPVNAAYQAFGAGGPAATLSKLSADGHVLLYSTLLSSLNQGIYRPSITSQALAVGSNGIAYIGGLTNEVAAMCTPSTGNCSGFQVTPGVVKPACTASSGNAGDCASPTGFLTAFDTTQSGAASLVYSTLIGGTEAGGATTQQVLGLAADSSNNVYVTGNTQATDYPTTAGAYQTVCTLHGPNCNTAFLSKINPAGTAYVWSSLYGADQPNLYSIGETVGLDAQGQVYLYGLAASGGADYVNPIQASKYGADKPFIGMFSADGSTLLFATQVGNSSTTSNENDEPIPSGGLNVDAGGNMYFAGFAADSGQLTATPGAYTDAAVSGGSRAFFGKLSCAFPPCPAPPAPLSNTVALTLSAGIASSGQAVTMTATVTGPQNQPAPTGLVGFYNGSAWLGNASLNGSGIATFTSSALPAGAYAVTANYLGDHLYPGAISTVQSLNISAGPIATTTTASNVSVPYSLSPQQITLSATVNSASGVVNTGSVSFTIYDLREGSSGLLTVGPAPPVAAVQNGMASVTATIQGGVYAPRVNFTWLIVATYTDSSSTFATSTDNTKLFSVSIATPVITWANPAGISTPTALGSAQLNATANTLGTFVYTPPSGTVLASGNGQVLSTTFTPTDTTDYTTATASVTINVSGLNPTTTVASNEQVTFNSTQPVTFTATVTSPGGVVNSGTVNFTVTNPAESPYTKSAPVVNGVASVSFAIPLGGYAAPGSYPIAAAYVPSGNFLASSDNTKQVTVLPVPLVITWATPAPIPNGTLLGFGQLNAAVAPTASDPECFYTPSFGTVLPGPGSYKLSVTCTSIIFGTGYTAATATVSIQVLSPGQTTLAIVWAPPAAIVTGTALSGTQLNAAVSPGAALATCAYTPGFGTILPGPVTYTLSVTCTPASAELANYAPATAAVSIQVLSITKTTPAIVWAAPAAIVTGTALSGTQLNATAAIGAPISFAVPGTFVYNPPLGAVLPIGNETIAVTFTPTDTTSYQTVRASVPINVISTAVSLSVPSVSAAFSASPTSATFTANVANASSTGGVAFTVLGVTTGQARVANGVARAIVTIPGGTQAGSYPFVANYSDPINPGITATGNANLVISPPKVTVTANSLTAAYSSSASVVTMTANVANATSGGYVFFASPAGINNGVAYLVNGVASGGFTIAAGTPAGTYPITAVYSDFTNGPSAASGTATLTILSAPLPTPTITWTGTESQTHFGLVNVIFSGTALSSAQLNATATVPGTFAYNPPAGTVLAVGGGQFLSVTFTPADPALYTTATATLLINVLPLVIVTPVDLTVPYSTASQTILASATVTNAALYSSVTFSLLGSTSAGAFTIPAGTPVGTYPIVATYMDAYDGVATTGTSELTITEPAAGSCPASSATLAIPSIPLNIPGAPNGPALNPKDADAMPAGSNVLRRSEAPILSPDGEMVSGSVQAIELNSQGSQGLAVGIQSPPTFPPFDMPTGGSVSIIGTGGTETGTLPPSTTPIVGCVSTSFLATVSGASLASGSSAIASVSTTLSDPATQNVFGLQISQRIVLP
jgi:hypothetical protein